MVCFPGALDTRPHLSLIIRTLACVLPFLNFEHYKDKKNIFDKSRTRDFTYLERMSRQIDISNDILLLRTNRIQYLVKH